ncbi:14-3-3 protein [Ditylenchus destructor]|nr:14-3-3 protein [Ditylenchus destructor]
MFKTIIEFESLNRFYIRGSSHVEKQGRICARAKLAKHAKRYDDMAQSMKNVVEIGSELSREERDLFTFAYNSVIEERQVQWYSALSVELMTEENEQLIAKENFKKTERQLVDVYTEVLTLLDKHLIPKTSNTENKVFYVKMKADCLRGFVEIVAANGQKLSLPLLFNIFDWNVVDIVKKTQQLYQEAFDIAKDKLQPTHPVQLALAFSFSQFYYEILNDPEKACQVALQALRDANAELANSMLIMELLRDNLIRWTSDTSADNQEWTSETGEAGGN